MSSPSPPSPPPPTTGPNERDRRGLDVLARGSVLTLAGSVASSVLGFVLLLVIGRGLGSGRAGQVFEVIALFTILANVAEAGADTGLVRFLARYRTLGRPEDLRRTAAVAVIPVMAAAVGLAAAVFAGADPLARVLFERARWPDGAALIRAFAPFLPFVTGIAVVLAGTRGLGTMKPFVTIQNFAVPLLRPLLIGAVVATGMGATALGMAWGLPVAAGFLLSVAALVAILGRTERRLSARAGPESAAPPASLGQLARTFWAFSGPRGGAALVTVGLGWVDVLLVGALRSSHEAGVYAAVSRFIGVGTIALQATAFSIAPHISALLARDRRGEAASLFRSATGWVVAASWPVYLTLALFAPVLLRVFGSDFVAGQHALVMLSLAMLVYVGVGNNKTVLLMAGGSGSNLLITGSWLAVSLVLDIVLIPRFGIEGAAIAYAVALIGENLTTTVVVMRRTGISPAGRGPAVAAIAAVGCYGAIGVAVRLAMGPSLPAFLIFATTSTSAYLVVLWRRRDDLDLKALGAVVRRRNRMNRSGSPPTWGDAGAPVPAPEPAS